MSFDALALEIPAQGLVFVGGEVKGSSVTASNGAGKSALFEALCWGLYGATLRGISAGDVVRWSAKKNCYVRVMLLDDQDNLWTVARYRNDSEHANSLYLYKEDDDMTGAGARHTQEFIDSITGMSWLVFSTAVVFGEKAQRFTEARDSEKKQIFDEILMLQRYQEAQGAVRRDLKELRDARASLNSALAVAESARSAAAREMEETESAIAELEASRESAQGRLSAIAVQLEQYKKEHQKAEQQLTTAQQAREELDVQNRELMAAVSQADRERLEIEQKASRPIIAKRVELTDITSRLAEARKSAQSLGSLRGKDKCPTCFQTLDTHSMDGVAKHYAEEVGKLEKRETLMKAELIKLQESQKAAVAEAKRNLDEVMSIKSQLDAQLRGKVSEGVTLTAKVRDLATKINALEREHDQLTMRHDERKRMLDAQMERVVGRAEVADLNFAHAQEAVKESESQEEYLTFWESGFGNQGIKSFLLDEILPALNDRVAYYATALLGDNMRILFDTESTLKSGAVRDKFDVRIVRDGVNVDYISCSNGERRRIDVAILLALQSLVYERNAAGCNLMVLDEVFDSLDRTGVEKVVGLLAEEAKEKVIYVISHLNEMRDYFENELIVTKTDGVSEVVQ